MSRSLTQNIRALGAIFVILFATQYGHAEQILDRPESVVFDSAKNRYLISNFGNGDIIELDSNGKFRVFNDELSSTTGLTITQNKLFAVSDTFVTAFNLETAEKIWTLKIPESVGLNDITADSSGNLYVTDSDLGKVFKIDINNKSSSVLADKLKRPNGTTYDADNHRLLICSLGFDVPIQAINLNDNALSTVTSTNLSHLDGIAQDNQGNTYVSSWYTHSVYKFDKDFSESPEQISSGHSGPADIFFNKQKNILAIPNMRANELQLVQIKEGKNESDLPIVLYHIHINRGFNIDDAVELSKELGIKFGVVDNFGRHYWNYSDKHLKQYLKRLKGKAVYKGIQAEGRDWMRVFSKELLSKLDFILADGMTFPNTNGTYSRLWRNEEVHIRNVDFFMDRYTDYLADIASEPIDIIANVTYLPEEIRADYDKLWTYQRAMKIINACVQNDVAIEINARYRIPSPKILKMAQKAGVKFAFGANSHNANQASNYDYCIKMYKQLGLSDKDMFKPGDKKIKQENIHNSHDVFSINVNNVQFEFVNIPPGEFYMGSNNCGDYSKPIHEVKIDYPFQMSKTEVTVAQFALFAEETGLVTAAEKQGHGGTVDHELWVKHRQLKWIQGKGIHWKNPGFKQGPDHPVVLITWDEANAFCDWLSQRTRSLIRLPSEAEWEYACRAGDVNEYPENLDEMAWYGANSPTYTHPVALKKPNAWGLYDILGNVWEMCLDCVNKGYVGAPTDGSPWLTSNINYTGATNERRVRGGAYNRQRRTLMYGYRYFTPGKSTNYGFRVVRLPDEETHDTGYPARNF